MNGLVNTGLVPIGSIIAYAGQISEAISSPPSDQAYPPKEQKTGLTNNIEGFGWMVCDGRALYCRAYPQLFQALGFLYSPSDHKPSGTPDKDSKFYLPDYRGYFLRGASGNTEVDPDQSSRKYKDESTITDNDNDVGSIQEDAIQTHEHIVYLELSAAGPLTKPSVNAPATPPSELPAIALPPNELSSEPTNSLTKAENTVKVSSETRPKNMYVYYLIKYCHVAQ